VSAEPWQGLLVTSAPAACGAGEYVPFGGHTTIQTQTKAEAAYLAKRKLLLVNGTHTTLAFLSLQKELAAEVSRTGQTKAHVLGGMSLPGPYPLVSFETVNKDNQRLIWAFLLARCSLLLDEFKLDVVKTAEKNETEDGALRSLLRYAWVTLRRFSPDVPDTTGRILNGGVVKRYNGRLKAVWDSLEESSAAGSRSVAAIVRAAAAAKHSEMPRVSAKYMLEAVENFVADAKCFSDEMTARGAQMKKTMSFNTFQKISSIQSPKKQKQKQRSSFCHFPISAWSMNNRTRQAVTTCTPRLVPGKSGTAVSLSCAKLLETMALDRA